ncbi:DUF4345 domain-containing protein [Winogradskyella luteola]|uniref:DUF4345 domain-containing protein n=1 Tax=Winogradskyella luteola TaxID=2828330 RepID=A0A9X1FAN1_9FLAO|nr:DUF4345 domain-containing protein [Winogradskyella luteola]MBV7269090.1 DUF4345 domain-containing protein [Winogradskyella luteola]
MTNKNVISKIHLIISIIIVVPVAFVYGFNPDSQFDIHSQTLDEQNFFKAIMGLYLGFSVVWLFGIFKINYLKLALVSNVVFMLGLALGRSLSWAIDGAPTQAYIIGTLGEFILGFYGLWVLITQHQGSTNT